VRGFCVAALLLISSCAGCEEDPELLGDAGITTEDAGPRDANPAGGDATANDATALDGTTNGDADADADAGAIDASPADLGVRGTCADSADCNGYPCVAIPDEPGGWHTCLGFPLMEVKFCNPEDLGCCNREDCTEGQYGRCVHGPLWYCGGPPPIEQNVCTYDECTTRADCTARGYGVCVPWLAFNEASNHCAYGDCIFDTDCTSRSGGLCMPFFDPCASRMVGFYCTYADSPCRTNADCAATPSGYCAPGQDGRTSCMQFIPPP
jgi:hypothetical protein